MLKRCFCLALALALLMPALCLPAFAEEAEVVSGNVESEVAPAQFAGDTGLTVDGEASLALYEDAPALDEVELELTGTPDADAAAEVCAVEAADDDPKAVFALNRTAVNIGLGEIYKGLAIASGSAKSVTWSSSNKKIARVDAATGAVTALRRGTCTITAKVKGGKKATCRVTVKKKPTSVSLDSTSLSLSAGMRVRLKASVPDGTASGALTFKSSKPKVASVSAKGKVTALKAGTATITVTTYNGLKAKCKVTVEAAPAGVTFPADSLSVAVGQKSKLKATARTADGAATPATIAYAIDDASPDARCVKLNKLTGSIKGVRQGQAVITATAQNGVMASYTVTVDVAPQSVALDRATLSLGVGEVFDRLAAKATPPFGAATCASAITWSSSDKSIATVETYTGAITALKRGSCTITATAGGGRTASCKVTVKKAPTGMSVTPIRGALKVGQTGRYELKLYPSGSAGHATGQSSDASIADVDVNGYVTALAPGEVTITITLYNGLSQQVTLVVSESDDPGGDDPGDDDNPTSKANKEKLEYVISVAQSQLGKPYVYGSGYSGDANPRGFDCSGLAYWCFKHIGITLKDTAYKQGYDESLRKIVDKKDLRRGDLVFFNTNESDGDLSDHTAIYLGKGEFIHASSSKGMVIISDMSQSGSYYDRAFSWGRRVLE